MAQEGNPFYDSAMEFQIEGSDKDGMEEKSSNNMFISQSNSFNPDKKRGKYKHCIPLKIEKYFEF